MSHCYYDGKSRRGNEIWSDSNGRGWVVDNMYDSIVQYCRKAFGSNYKNMWINPVYFDDKYFRHTEDFFSEVGVELYPKLTNVRNALKEAGLSNCSNTSEAVRAFIHDLAESDIAQNIERGVKPVCVIVTGVRYSDPNKKGEFVEKFTGVRKVRKLV